MHAGGVLIERAIVKEDVLKRPVPLQTLNKDGSFAHSYSHTETDI